MGGLGKGKEKVGKVREGGRREVPKKKKGERGRKKCGIKKERGGKGLEIIEKSENEGK